MRTLRLAQSLTQEQLAEYSGLSVDAIRRIERDGLSPSLRTIEKIARGFRLSLGTLFTFYVQGQRDLARELIDLLTTRTPEEVQRAQEVLLAMFAREP